jgi:MFS family permease
MNAPLTQNHRAVFAPLILTLFVFISVGLLIPLTTTTVVDRLHEPKKFIGYAIGAMVYTCAATLVVSNVAPERRSRFLGLLGSAVWGGLSVGPALAESITRVEAAGVFTAVAGLALFVLAQLLGNFGTPNKSKRRLWPSFPRPAIVPSVCIGCYNLGYAAITGFLILHLRANNIDAKHALSFYALAVLFGRIERSTSAVPA